MEDLRGGGFSVKTIICLALVLGVSFCVGDAFGQFFDYTVHDVIVSDPEVYHVVVDSLVNEPPFTNRTSPRVLLNIGRVLKGSPPAHQTIASWQPHPLRLFCETGEESTIARWERRPISPPRRGAWIISGTWYDGHLTVSGATRDSGQAATIVYEGVEEHAASVRRQRQERQAEDIFYSSYIENALPDLNLDSLLARSCTVVSGTVVDVWVGLRGLTVRLDSLNWLTGPSTIPRIVDLEDSTLIGDQMNFAPVCSWEGVSSKRAHIVRKLMTRGSRVIAFVRTRAFYYFAEGSDPNYGLLPHDPEIEADIVKRAKVLSDKTEH
jgi:hypothetical protein